MAILGFSLIFLITSFTTSKLIFLDPSDFFKYFKYFENLHALAICVIFLGLMLERSMNKLVLTYRTADDAAVEQLVKAAFRMANSFVSCSAVHEVLTRVGVSAKILRKNKIMVKFLNPVEILANDDPSTHTPGSIRVFSTNTQLFATQRSVTDAGHCRRWKEGRA